MIVDQAELDLVLNRRIRQRVIQLPVRHGEFGELKRCPAKVGGIYTLKPRIPYPQYRAEASQQPTRARGVLWLIDRCERRRTATITVQTVERQGEAWLIGFIKGEQQILERPRLLSAKPDFGPYTDVVALSLKSGAEEVQDAWQQHYAENGRERHADLRSELSERALAAIAEIKRHAPTGKARNELTWAEKRVRAVRDAMR